MLVEIDGRLLADLQPEAVRAALRDRPGEAFEVWVLREAADGSLSEVPVRLVAQ